MGADAAARRKTVNFSKYPNSTATASLAPSSSKMGFQPADLVSITGIASSEVARNTAINVLAERTFSL